MEKLDSKKKEAFKQVIFFLFNLQTLENRLLLMQIMVRILIFKNDYITCVCFKI